MFASPLDHVKWFVDPSAFSTMYALLLSPTVLLSLGAAIAAIVLAALYERRFPEPPAVKILERFARSGPLVLGLHLGTNLIVAAAFGLLFVPSLRVPNEALGLAILGLEAACGVLFVLGLATRPAAIVLALLGLVAMRPFTFESILEQVHLLGMAAFLFLVGRGPLSLDRVRGVAAPIRGSEVPAAALTLVRVAMGFAIAYSALTEKLLNPPLAQAFLDRYPYFNVARAVGVTDGQFAYLAGTVELAVGAVIVSGFVTRPVAAIGAVLFTATLFFLGWPELLGHLPFYGILFLLFIAPKADSRRVRAALRPAS